MAEIDDIQAAFSALVTDVQQAVANLQAEVTNLEGTVTNPAQLDAIKAGIADLDAKVKSADPGNTPAPTPTPTPTPDPNPAPAPVDPNAPTG